MPCCYFRKWCTIRKRRRVLILHRATAGRTSIEAARKEADENTKPVELRVWAASALGNSDGSGQIFQNTLGHPAFALNHVLPRAAQSLDRAIKCAFGHGVG